MLERRVTLGKNRRNLHVEEISGLQSKDVATWMTLQKVTLSQPGVCTDPGMFYHTRGQVHASSESGQILLGREASVFFNTAFNVLGLEALDRTCNLGRVAIALRGAGRVEVIIPQGLAGRSWQRVLSAIVTLDPVHEVILELDPARLGQRDGAIWIELSAIDDDGARFDSGRFLTDTPPDPNLRLAVCLSQGQEDGGRKIDHLLTWAAAQTLPVCVLTCGETTAPGLVTLKPEANGKANLAAMLTEAKRRAFTHALVISDEIAVGAEILDRTLACLQILRDQKVALGAGALDAAERVRLDNNGLTRNAEGKLSPLSALVNLTDINNVLETGYDALADQETEVVPQSTFLAVALSALGNDPAEGLASERFDFGEVICINEGSLTVQQMPGLLLSRDTFGRKISGLMTLQNVIFPEQGICTESDMYFHAMGPVVYDAGSSSITLEHGSTAFFDTYFNALSIGKWHQNCRLNGLWLGVTGRGRVEIKVFHAIPDRSWEHLATAVVSLSRQNQTLVDLGHYAENATRGMIYFEVRALSHGVAIFGAGFLTEAEPDPSCRLALSITTFKREAQVENTARRLALYFDHAEFAEYMDCFIVDNGNSAKIAPHPKIRRIPNANLGGAGGFTRGLLEAEEAGYSHVLFMDDDASTPMETLHRTYAFLALAKDPKTAVAGAMINSAEKWRMFENGAMFDRKCQPMFSGTDLRNRDAVFWMENESALSRSSKMYGGWWFFAFPVGQVTRHPFPFFVRGDDVNFCLSNEFAITTLNGVVSFAEDFTDKESPLTWYLDLRSHMVHHLTLAKMEVGRVRLARIGVSFFLRNIVKFQYETVEAVLKAWADVLRGPDFFAQNADASAQRAAIKSLTKQEAWKPAADVGVRAAPALVRPSTRIQRMIYPLTLNGHFLPFFGLWGAKRVIPAVQRGHLDAVWGAAQLTYLTSARDKGYVTRRSNTKAFGLLLRMVWLWLRTVFSYDRLRARYRERYPQITTPVYWREALVMQTSNGTASAAPTLAAR